jgi:HAE1 family hydrophobic/amphiphilic exporter-1
MPCEVVASGSNMDMSALGGSGVSIQIRGDEIETLQKIAKEVATIVASVEGTKEVSDGMDNPDPQLKITVNKNEAILKGLTVAQVYQVIAGEINTSSDVTTLRYDMTDYPVVVLGAGSEIDITRQELADYQFTVTNKDGSISSIALSEIATVEEGESLSSIRRDGQQRYLTVSASLIDGYNIGLVSQEIEDAIKDYELPRGYEIISSGENENINDALVEMVKMLLLAIAFIYLIMVAQFQSLLSPFIVMFTIPLAFTGGFVGLILTGNAVSVISMIGFVMLAGIIVNNGIVLVDYIIQLRLDGMNKRDALIEAGKTRMRPILMTALTTVLGLSTMALGIGMGADMVQPIAIVTIGGLLYATITTLFVIPVLYDIFNRKELKKISEEELKLYEEL